MSQRTIYRMVQEGKLRQSVPAHSRRRPLPIFHPDDVATFEEQRVKEAGDPAARFRHGKTDSKRTFDGQWSALEVGPRTDRTSPPLAHPSGSCGVFRTTGRHPARVSSQRPSPGHRRRTLAAAVDRWRIRQVDLRKLNAIPLETHYKVLADPQQV